MTMQSSGVLPRVDANWLALPLSARGLIEELAKIVDDDGGLETSLADGADARAIGDELARLPTVTKVLLSQNPTCPLARWVRWNLSVVGTATASWDMTFRILAACNAVGQITQ